MTDLATLAAQIGFSAPDDYNAARLLWQHEGSPAPAIHHKGGTLTYADLVAEAARIGNHLRAHARPGDRVLLLMEDEPAYPAAIMGAMRAGLVPMLINTLSPGDLLAFYLSDSGATLAVASDAFAPALNGLPVRVLNAAGRPWAEAPATLDEHPTGRGDIAFWMYSSGSTGRPKGVVHLHRDVPYAAAAYGAQVLKLTADDICFSVPKIFFAYGFGNSVLFPMATGASAVLMAGRPDPQRIFAALRRHQPTVFFGLPTLYTALTHDSGFVSADTGSLRLCLSAAEVLSPEIAAAWTGRTGLPIIEGLGSTEMLHIYLSNSPDRQVPGSAGRVVPGYAVRLVDGDGAPTTGEGIMQVRGGSMMPGYWNRPDKDAETLRDGWLHTGDRFTVDTQGFFFFKGRADDLVKVSGQWVWPMEIEHALNDHPDVREACVLAVPLPDGRTTIAAWVALRSGAAGDGAMVKALQTHAKSRLLPHKYPRQVTFLDDLPKTGTGKIDRQALRRLAD
jgi:benzoate-CoA ligase family protein